jgi:predicted nucleic acid-binding Zn ribbon protein
MKSSKKGGKAKGKASSKKEVMPCPMCGTSISKDAKECPKCGEPFSPEVFASGKISKSVKLFFWAGFIQVMIGGALAFGSWLHDLLDLGIVTDGNPNTFGWFNRLVALIGIIILVIGIIFLIISLSKMEKQDIEDMEISESEEEQGG